MVMQTKLILILLSTTLLQGCIWQTTSVVDIEKAIDYCKDKGGLHEIEVFFSSSEYATCVGRNFKVSGMLGLYIIEGEENDRTTNTTTSHHSKDCTHF